MREATILRPLYVALVLITTAIASTGLWGVLRVDGLTWIEGALWAIFTLLFGWIAVGFWLYCLGAYAHLRGSRREVPALLRHDAPESPTRTAILMPIYNESADRVFAGIRAMLESIRATGAGDKFDFFILSDSTKPECWVAEEIEWRRLCQTVDVPVYYRHRPSNIRRKPGNIADFCTNWGSLYDYMVVLDADSLMTGDTLVALAGMMDVNPRTALIQVPPLLIGGASLFSAIQQFTSRVYGPLCSAGLALLQGAGGNYWGHNAIIRTKAFIDHCGLPKLSGTAPLGGEILSHDFVEAALLRRAGWDLWLAPELGGSFEETPSSIVDYLARDRRWCQGNMQHMRLLFAQGFKLSSRLHFAIGIMSYLSSPLWLLLLFISVLETRQHPVRPAVFYFGRYPILNSPVSHVLDIVMLVFATVVLLFGPKLIALLSALGDPKTRRGFGGAGRLALGVLGESIFSMLYAPIAMLSHSWFVFNILLGRGITWTPPRRGDSATSLSVIAQLFVPHMIVALAVGFIAWYWLADTFWWLLPLLIGPAFAVLLVKLSEEPSIGRALSRVGLFQIPGDDLAIARRVDDILRTRGAHALGRLDNEELVRLTLAEPLIEGLRAVA